MAGEVEGHAPPSISALPPTTVRQLGSHQLLTDPGSIVKELIDNALDARAKSIFVDITANTIDSIQVKDDGHGISSEDRALACRRYCTSKIRDFHDLKQVGGKWLGFRGEALACIADMSGTVSITTRVEGEPVAVKLTYHRNGELASTERESHPVGSTVKVTKLLESAKVRKELAIKNSAKCLAKIRRLLQAYALARPATRFRLHVVQSKNNKGDFVYAPKANANVKDAAFKIVGKDCALQCDWTSIELAGFDLRAFLPNPTAIGSKVATYGAFISVDSRPVSAVRGTLKKIAAAVRSRLRASNSTLANMKDPFFCMNIICPVDSYDPNIEPAKDDVVFGDEAFIISLVDRLLVSHYPEVISNASLTDQSQSGAVVVLESNEGSIVDVLSRQSHRQSSARQSNPGADIVDTVPESRSQRPQWRSNMFGIDKEHLDSLRPDAPYEEEEVYHNVALSNPWTIARMNAPIKPSRIVSNGQLLSPAKSQGSPSSPPRSPTPAKMPARSKPFKPVTPLNISDTAKQANRLDEELLQSTQRMAPADNSQVSYYSHDSNAGITHCIEPASFDERMSLDLAHPLPHASIQGSPFSDMMSTRDNVQSRQPLRNRPPVPQAQQAEDTWFGQPMRNAPKTVRPEKRVRQNRSTCFPKNNTSSSQRSLVLPAAERMVETKLASKNNTDIRSFFSKPRHDPVSDFFPLGDRDTQPPDLTSQLQTYAEQENPVRGLPRRPQSADARMRSIDMTDEMDRIFQLHQNGTPVQSSSPVRSLEPSNLSTGQHRPQLRRPRTTEGGLHRTKSSTLPLNFIPLGSATQELSLSISTSISCITRCARSLDMNANSLEWGYDSAGAFDAFNTPLPERKIMSWVIRVDDLLHTVFERVDGVEIRGALHEGIQRFLDARREEEEENIKRTAATMHRQVSRSVQSGHGPQDVENSRDSLSGDPGKAAVAKWREELAATDAPTEADEVKEDFDMAQFVDFDGGARAESPLRIVKTEDEYGDDIEDEEMLMGF